VSLDSLSDVISLGVAPAVLAYCRGTQWRLDAVALIKLPAPVGERGEKLFQAANRLGLEGVIGKKAKSPYRRGRTLDWVKVKTAHGRNIDEERAKWNE
jgi:hypothetical protein